MATVCVATAEDLAFDDAALSLIQLRAAGHQQAQTSAEGQRPFDMMEKKINGEWGPGEVIDRPHVDENRCDTWYVENGARKVREEKVNCKIEYRDESLGAIRDGPGDMITGVRFFAKQAGNNDLRFRVYRNNGFVADISEAIEVPKAGVIQEVTFKKPMLLLKEDWVGWSHNGKGNIAYSEEAVYIRADGWESAPVFWRATDEPGDSDVKNKNLLTWWQTQHGNCQQFQPIGTQLNGRVVLPAGQRRTYSYSLITRPATKDDLPEKICFLNPTAGPPPQSMIDSLPDGPPEPAPTPAPEPEVADADDAAAVGDPHLTTNTGSHFDLH